MKYLLLSILLITCSLTSALAQDSLLLKALEQNRSHFYYMPHSGGFEGQGWYKISNEANASKYTLIGEMHGIKEVSMLTLALYRSQKYKAYVMEVDPWLAQILRQQSRKDAHLQRPDWFEQNNQYLSFYSYQPDFALLQRMPWRQVRFMGIDQITLLNDVPVYEHLASLTRNRKRKARYRAMATASRVMLQDYTEGKTKMLYLPSEQFATDLQELRKQKLPSEEKEILDALELSHQIYNNRKEGHQRRITLMKQQLMQFYQQGQLNDKTLFRFGAMHSSRNESYFSNFDVGNLVHNLAESQNSSSYHVAIFAKAGETAVPFKGMPAQQIKPDKNLAPLFSLASDSLYTYFDLRPIRQQLEKQQLSIENDFLRKTIKGYDGFIVVPVATAAQF